MVMEPHLHNEVRAKTLSATHYHELRVLADHLDKLRETDVNETPPVWLLSEVQPWQRRLVD